MEEVLCRLASEDPACREAINVLAAGSFGEILIARLRHLTKFDEDLSRDLAQETWRLVWKARGTWEAASGEAAVAYVFAVARRVVLSSVRREQRLINRNEIAASLNGPHDSAFGAEDFIDLQTGLQRMRPTERNVLALAYEKGLSDQDIAEALGISYAAAKKRRQEALARLRKLYFNPPRR